MDLGSFNIIKDILRDLDIEIDSDSKEAKKAYKNITEGNKYIVPIDKDEKEDVNIYRSKFSDLLNWKSNWISSYGIDSSTTTPIEYSNGLDLDIGIASFGVVNKEDRSLESKSTVKVVFHQNKESKGDYPKNYRDSSGEINAELIDIPIETAEKREKITDIMKHVTQKSSEIDHLTKNYENIDSILFIDGRLYPENILYRRLYTYGGSPPEILDWERYTDILNGYIELIEKQNERDLPVVGIVKTSRSRSFINSLDLESIKWKHDFEFMDEVLKIKSVDHITYTPWFERRKIEIGGTTHSSLFEGQENILNQNRDISEYNKAFFYLRLPRQKNIFRVETPKFMVDSKGKREKIQNKTLKEIVRNEDVPAAIKRAEENSRISISNRNDIKDLLGKDYYKDYNKDGRYEKILRK